jgi:PKD repeat protein
VPSCPATSFYFASRVDGTLHRVTFTAGTTDAGSDVVVSGPSLDGNDWRARGMFLFGAPTKPTASFTSSCPQMTCTFDASGSTPATGLSYAWTFGDGATSTGVNPVHTYATTGSHSVSLTVTDALSQTATTTSAVSTTLGPPPTASFTSACTLLSCSFDGTASTGPSGGVAGYAWDFGDGQTGSGATVAHAYATPGAYTVALTVTDGLGQTATTTHAVVASAMTFVGSSQSAGTGTSRVVTVPAGVTAGNGLLLVGTAVGATAPTAPAGWTLVRTTSSGTSLTTSVWSRVATASDAGTSVTVGFATSVQGNAQLLAYSGTSTTNPVAVVASSSSAVSSSTETTPVATVTAAGSWAVSLWQIKTTAATGWTAPGALVARSTVMGTGGGHTGGLAADAGAAVATGSYGGQVATLNGPAGSATLWTIILAPAS